jgi:hypothetical protein
MFYTWLESWKWDFAAGFFQEDPRKSCLNRYYNNIAVNSLDKLKIDACACDVIVTDCHVNAYSLGSGPPENSGPFNVYNGVSASAGKVSEPRDYTRVNSTWWDAGDFFMPDTVGYAGFGTSGLCSIQTVSSAPHELQSGLTLLLSCHCRNVCLIFVHWKQMMVSRALQQQIRLKLL